MRWTLRGPDDTCDSRVSLSVDCEHSNAELVSGFRQSCQVVGGDATGHRSVRASISESFKYATHLLATQIESVSAFLEPYTPSSS